MNRSPISILPLLLLLSAGCTPAAPATAPAPRPPAAAPAAPADALATPPGAALPAEWRLADRTRVLSGERSMVTSGNVIASQVGRDVLRHGGNAVDAAVAVGFAMAVVDPEAGNIGGGGFMVVRLPDGAVHVLDYRERAPAAATRDMFLEPDGEDAGRSRVGHLASGVPGSVAGLAEAHRRFGRRPFTELVAPAVALAREGFILDSMRSARLRGDSTKLARFPASVRAFFPDGRVPAVGERLVQPDLARTLAAIAERGADGFYRGWVADSLVAEMARGGGLITHADLAAYRPLWRDPVVVRYRGYSVLGAPPASSGGITMGLLLGMLEAGGPLPAFGSAAMLHRYAEVMRRSFALRRRHLGDPDFTDIPQAWLLSRALADSLVRSIAPDRATPTLAGGVAGTGSTTHYSVADPDGMVVSTTTTVNDLYGSGVTVAGAGFLLNDEMDDFNTAPGRPNSWGLVDGDVNAPAPGKRPLSSMTPTIVLDPEGQVLALLGSRGGPTIITQVLQVVVNLIDYRMTLPEAVSAPRVHHQGMPDALRVDRDGFAPAVLDSLRAMGHAVQLQSPGGDVEAIARGGRGWVGVSDPRSGGGPAGD